MDGWIVFAVFLYLVCAALLIADVFVPSAGLLALCGIGCLAGGVAIFFQQSALAGWIGVGVAIVMIPAVLVGAYKVFPKTRFGKNATLAPPEKSPGEGVPDIERLNGLVGEVGRATTMLRPVGICEFGRERVECVAESGYIEKGTQVKVIRAESTQLTVRIVEEK